MNKDKRNNRLLALGGTLLFHLAIVLILVFTWLLPSGSANPLHKVWEPDSTEILFGGEYVELGDFDVLADLSTQNVPSNDVTMAGEESQRNADDMDSHGQEGAVSQNVSSMNESPMKETTRPLDKPTGPQKGVDEEKPKDKLSPEKEKQKNDFTNFSNQSNPDGAQGNPGSPDGSDEQGSSAGVPGHNLRGRTIAYHESFSAPKKGVIRVSVKVDREGRVIEARFLNGTNPAAADMATRNLCVAKAKKVRFSVNDDAPAEQSGMLIFTIN